MASAFRAPVLWLTDRRAVRRLTTAGVGRRVARRFVAGERVDDALRVARELNEQGVGAMLNLLGENVVREEQAAAAAGDYVLAVKRITDEGIRDANVSVKLTQLGLDLSRKVCLENAERVLEAAADAGILVMIDMESSPYVEETLGVYRTLRERFPGVGVCIQAYLRRTAEDARALAAEGATVRVCKGAYLEPPEVAYRRRWEVGRSYRRVAATLLAAGCTVHLATHDERLIEGAEAFIRSRGIPRERYEFQMIYGVRRDLQARLSGAGQPVRVYVPYGPDWYPYLTRRLAERPANLWFFATNVLRRKG